MSSNIIKELIDNNNKIYERAKRIKELSQNVDLTTDLELLDNGELYYYLTSSFSPQRKAPLGEKFLCHKLKLESVLPKEDRGDAKDIYGNYYEFKCSFTNVNKSLNIRQIRPWQEVDFYYCFYINEEKIDDSMFFVLTKEEMLEEIKLCGSFTHGVTEINNKNTHCEYSITIPVYSTTNKKTIRWKEKYLSKELKEEILAK